MNKLKLQLIPLIIGALFATTELMAIEEPEYKVVEKNDVYEIREYLPVVAIETEVEANFEDAGNRAFRRLFNYIDGNNQSQASIAMTAPVTQSASESEKIAMTAPVTQSERDGKYVVRFMLPAKYTLETAPKPNDPTVVVTELPARRFAVHRYSGTWAKSGYDDGLAKLKQALNRGGVDFEDAPIWSRYNSPFSVWFLRRNEIWLPLAD